MNISRPALLIMIGFALAVLGVVVPFLMVLKILPSTFTLSFLSYAASVSGVFLGVIGAAMYIRFKQKP